MEGVEVDDLLGDFGVVLLVVTVGVDPVLEQKFPFCLSEAENL